MLDEGGSALGGHRGGGGGLPKRDTVQARVQRMVVSVRKLLRITTRLTILLYTRGSTTRHGGRICVLRRDPPDGYGSVDAPGGNQRCHGRETRTS